ncbi:phage integrase SAM-like domain-containing protein [Spirosoma panaciterrae]|uniref:phage integrase SAM-like domain-containing protein n=1 Tax=Spirosoma panaciterrae TaxID=496058 RepID=UPI00036AC2D6|nr:phage integrase SAM-like domain-containing protein [Spirosoma panaciterrae]
MHTRRKREISVLFRLRYDQKNDTCLRPLKIRLTINGETASDYCSGIYIRPTQWDQKAQKVKGSGPLVTQANEKLAEVAAQHYEILRRLKERNHKGQGKRPTAQLVKQEFLRPGTTSPRLHQWFKTYLDYLDTLDGTEDGRSEKTVHRLYKAWEYVKQFDPSSSFLTDLTTGWGKRFHAWLQTHPDTGKRRMQKDSANKYLSHVRDAINHAIDEGYLTSNVLDKFRPKRGKNKEVYFMEANHIANLMKLSSDDPQFSAVLWWTRLMCFTGLDYVDAIRYARQPELYEYHTPYGVKIIINRTKPPRNLCEIPKLYQVNDLLAQHPTGPVDPNLADMNRHLKVIQPIIGFIGKTQDGRDWKLTTKILRKTAGPIFLRLGYSKDAVSKFLGHSSVRTTEEHYVKITSSFIDVEMERVARQQWLGNVPLRPIPVGNPYLSTPSL